mmetsp:Transcript_17500/g.26977  ORF Transcript_17500/g.26977 Transcript_17500/m.26977 type:complete len:91 (+) Transcript_17500:514-786(+)
MNKKGGVSTAISSFVEVNYFGNANGKPKDENGDAIQPTSTSIVAFKDGVNILVDTVASRLQLLNTDLIEPLELYMQHRDQTCRKQFEAAK